MIRFRELILILLLCSPHLLCIGSDPSFSKLSVENGLSNNLVNGIYKDSYGFMWFGTLEGLDRYDGVEIRPYSSRFPETVENVLSITEDIGKHLWVGTATGLFRHNSLTDRFERIEIDKSNIKVHALAMLSDSSLCVGTNNGLYLVNTTNLQTEHVNLNDKQNKKAIDITEYCQIIMVIAGCQPSQVLSDIHWRQKKVTCFCSKAFLRMPATPFPPFASSKIRSIWEQVIRELLNSTFRPKPFREE